MKEKQYYFYKTTNLLNGHYYYGVRSHVNPENDPYLGSGVRLKEAIQKYGQENFHKEIQAYFPTMEKAYEYEALVVTRDLVLDPNCYNVQLGGDGGTLGSKFFINEETGKIVKVLPEFSQQYLEAGYKPWRRPHSKETRQRMSQSHKGKPGTMKGKHHSEETRQKISEAGKGHEHSPEWRQKVSATLKGHKYWGNPDALKGRTRSEESRAKQRATIAERGRVAWNRGKTGCYAGGTVWVNNGQRNKRAKQDRLDDLLKQGWIVGRVKRQ